MVVHTCNPSTKESKVERTCSLAASLGYVEFGYIVGLHSKKRKKEKKETTKQVGWFISIILAFSRIPISKPTRPAAKLKQFF